MPKSEALKKAQVSAFDAKRYLSSFSQFVPSGRFLMQGGMVSSRVPEILRNFKKMEENGLSMEQIEQAIAGNLAQGRQPDASSIARLEYPSIQTEQAEANRLLPLINLLLNLMIQVAENQAGMQGEILKLIQIFEGERNALHTRIAKLEKTTANTE
jgi:hypothetical protein